MAGEKQKAHLSGMSNDTFSTAADEGGRRARSPLAVRIILAVVAMLLIAAAGLGSVNLYASSVYDQATESLNTNLATYEQEDADLDALALSQRQTDALFADATEMNTVLLPHLRDAIEHNAAISKALSDQIAADLDQAQRQASGSPEAVESEGGENSTNNGSSDNSGSSGSLTDEQRKKIEELLESNQRQTSPTPSPDSTNDDENNVNKPW